MARTKTMPIRVNEYEGAVFEEMARLEKLPLGTFIRRRLLIEAEQRGIIPHNSENHSRTGEVSPEFTTDAAAV